MSKLNYFLDHNNDSKTVYDYALEYINKHFQIHYNEIAQIFEIKKKNDSELYEVNINSLFIKLQKANVNISIRNLEVLLKSDLIPSFNPISNYFETIEKWDGVDYISSLSSFVKTSDNKSFEYHLKKWMVRTVKCALEDQYFNKQCLVLVHKGQGSGKSTWCRFLTPPPLKKYSTEDLSTDKDSRIQLTKNFIINLDELASLGKRDINAIKSYFSRTFINERLPYDKTNSNLPRICSFIGSTNRTDFLNDPTGSVRWLCFELVDKIDFNYSKTIDINNVWSQAFHLAYSSNDFNPELTTEDVIENEKRNLEFTSLTKEQELIIQYYEKSNDIDHFKTSTSICLELKDFGIETNFINIGKALNGLNFERIKHPKLQVYGYLAIFIADNTLK